MLAFFIAAHCLFSPPPKWEIADPKIPSKRAIVGFINKKGSGFFPSLNLTYEKISISEEEYLSIVQKNCLNQKKIWRHLGQIETKSGKAHLIEIETKTKFGPARLLQAILIWDGEAHILTGGALKKDFGKNAQSIEQAIRSMHLCDDLFEYVQDEKIRLALIEAWQKKKAGLESEVFEKIVLEQSRLGAVWQVSMLKL